jgi:flagellar biosynthesis GTPase FlhF
LPNFRFDKALGIARDTRARMEFKQIRNEIESKRQESEQAKNEIKELRNKLKSKRQEARQIRKEQRTAKDEAERSEYGNWESRAQQEILQLERALRVAKERRAGSTPSARPAPRAEDGTGALPDFVIIGGKKCGTTFLYHLLTQHPLVERAAGKEVHFFNRSFDEGIEWYRRCFPTPRWKAGRRSITGEATPEYLTHPLAPKRMAEVIPQARLTALLRNPVDRAYSDYHQQARKGRDTRTLEEAVDHANLEDARSGFLSRSIYVDHLQRWSEFFSDEQMLMLKSEDFFERPVDTLQVVLDFLDLPEWKPKVWELRYKRNKGKYKEKIDPATRQRLEDYFEPRNRRLYEYLGVDFGW